MPFENPAPAFDPKKRGVYKITDPELLKIRETAAEERRREAKLESMKNVQFMNINESNSPEAAKLRALRQQAKSLDAHKNGQVMSFNIDEIRAKTDKTEDEIRWIEAFDAASEETKKKEAVRDRIKGLRIESGEAEIKPTKLSNAEDEPAGVISMDDVEADAARRREMAQEEPTQINKKPEESATKPGFFARLFRGK